MYKRQHAGTVNLDMLALIVDQILLLVIYVKNHGIVHIIHLRENGRNQRLRFREY